MEIYIPTKSVFESLLSQQGGGIDRYILGSQKGEGLGNFFSKIFRHVRPILGRAFNLIKPELSNIGTKLIDSASSAAVSKINETSQKAKDRINKRQRDNLDG